METLDFRLENKKKPKIWSLYYIFNPTHAYIFCYSNNVIMFKVCNISMAHKMKIYIKLLN